MRSESLFYFQINTLQTLSHSFSTSLDKIFEKILPPLPNISDNNKCNDLLYPCNELQKATKNVTVQKAKREKRKETLQTHRHAPMHVSECTHKYATDAATDD
jgi:hypothetical protein